MLREGVDIEINVDKDFQCVRIYLNMWISVVIRLFKGLMEDFIFYLCIFFPDWTKWSRVY